MSDPTLRWFIRLQGSKREAVHVIRGAAQRLRPESEVASLQDSMIDAYMLSYVPFDDEDSNADGSGDVPCRNATEAVALMMEADSKASLAYSICLSADDGAVKIWAYLADAAHAPNPVQFCESRIDRVAVAGAIGIAARTAYNAIAAALARQEEEP